MSRKVKKESKKFKHGNVYEEFEEEAADTEQQMVNTLSANSVPAVESESEDVELNSSSLNEEDVHLSFQERLLQELQEMKEGQECIRREQAAIRRELSAMREEAAPMTKLEEKVKAIEEVQKNVASVTKELTDVKTSVTNCRHDVVNLKGRVERN